MSFPESSLKNSIFSSAWKAVKSCLIILLVTNQSRIIFYVTKEISTALPHIFWVIYLSGRYIIIKGSSETTLSHIFWVLYQSGIESNTKKHLLTALLHITWVL